MTAADTLTVAGLSVRYGGVQALTDVDVAVRRGEILGVIGPNGAGKSTLLDAISGFAPVTAGTIELGGRPIASLRPHQRARSGVTRTWQHLALFAELTVAENIRLAVLPSSGADRRRRAHHHHSQDITRGILDRLGLAAVADRLPDELSHGQQVLIGIGRALAGAPAVLLMDEPAAGLDVGERRRVADLVRALAREGTAVVIVDHDMPLLLGLCDQICVLDFGRVIARGAPDQVRRDPTVIAAYLGTSDDPPGDALPPVPAAGSGRSR